MAEIKVTAWQWRADRTVKMTVWCFPDGVTVPEPLDENTGSIAHFEITLDADAIIAAFALPPAERGPVLLALIKADPKIEGVIVSERAQQLLQATYTPPFVTSI